MTSKNQPSLKNQNGFVGAMLVIAVAVVVGIIIVGITHKMGDLNKAYDKSRAFYDSEIAIEKFSVSLKNAYDKANYMQDMIPNTGGNPALGDYGCPGKLVTLGTGGANTVKLCWEFGGSGNKLCAKRSREAGGPVDICLESSNLQVRIKTPNEWEVAMMPTEKSFADRWAFFQDASIEFFKDLGVSKAHANLDAFKPLLPALVPSNSIVLNGGFRSLPESPNCTVGAANPYQCLKVSFCVKNVGTCNANELIRQAYLFAKPAPTSQGW
ncbi:hypothetical protein [Bdellovibrio sp. HCB337]|uniref:hypothetical protein n=1 Tax=Bdellovibrio sp. HCB337 TaxID=3394358 RepID=UPI0039A62575